jgi:hypothetical protein
VISGISATSVTKRYRIALEEIDRLKVDEAERERLLAAAREDAKREWRRKIEKRNARRGRCSTKCWGP